jgi:hypothetical protein
VSGYVLGADAELDLDEIGNTSPRITSTPQIAGLGSCSMR